MNRSELEQHAIDAHRLGTNWTAFWQQHGTDVAALEPWDLERRRRLVRRLSLLVCAGDLDGQPIRNSWPRPEPWELDAAEPV